MSITPQFIKIQDLGPPKCLPSWPKTLPRTFFAGKWRYREGGRGREREGEGERGREGEGGRREGEGLSICMGSTTSHPTDAVQARMPTLHPLEGF